MKTALLLLLGLGVMATPGMAAPVKSANKAPAEKKEGVIAGQTIVRKADRGFLGLQVVDGKFKLTYYDKDKLPVAADHPRALLRWPARYKSGDDRAVLNQAGDGTFLTSPKFVRPPYNFRLIIVLISEADDAADSGDGATETYPINFQQ